MKLYEYEGKSLFRQTGMIVPDGEAVETVDQAVAAAERIGYPAAIKSQVLKGGRGKAGGIGFAANRAELIRSVSDLLGRDLGGETVDRLLIESRVQDVVRELYAGITLDARTMTPLLMFSTQGGVDIEEVVARNPEAIVREHLDPDKTYRLFDMLDLVASAGLFGPEALGTAKLLLGLIKCYFKYDAFTAEINPILTTGSGRVFAADSKIDIDDSSVKRVQAVRSFHRTTVYEDPLEAEAAAAGLAYVRLDGGNIGIICSGAGLAMATMDAVAAMGGRPANFLDLGGAAPPEKVAAALRIVLRTEGVKGVLFNVFGGSNNCLKMAQGIAEVVDQDRPDQTIIVKMRGYNQEEGWLLLEERGVPINKFGSTAEAIQMMLDRFSDRGIE